MIKNLVLYAPSNRKVRYGRNADGGYILIDGYNYDYFISGGVGGDISFEVEFCKNNNITGLVFDGTTEKPSNLPDKLIFVKRNIDVNNDLSEYLKEHKNIFLKMDIEGGEYVFFEKNFDNLANIKQMVFEIHGSQTCNKERAIKILSKINETHYLVHVHENNNGGELILTDGILVPPLMELTFIRKDCEVNGFNKEDLPIKELDYENVINKPQHNINYYPFKHE